MSILTSSQINKPQPLRALRSHIFYVVFFSSIIFSGCVSVYEKGSTPNSVVIKSHSISGSISSVNNQALQYCRNYGSSPVLRDVKKGGLLFFGSSDHGEYDAYYFDCVRQDKIERVDSSKDADKKNLKGNQKDVDLSEYKKRCSDLGFKPNTEEFGKCVLQLSK